MIFLNGEERDEAGSNLDDLLLKEGYDKVRIAVGLNGQAVSKENYSDIILKDNDVVEVFHFMGGG